ncbi:SipW-dependent-type signal peptide-containing protein [Haloarchaeobius sp. DT45]|uniref:SipW-dependent-type signal peptide-containing protein n=1 Tax=Haloarchaeobius sp. DT45 TaxID=3446116 RepID=UPI003F6AE403
MTKANLSRRQVLAGLGTIGVASAGAGLGTTAFFSDTEELEGWFEAGRVDLLLDYRTTYMPWERYDLQMVPEDQRPPVVPGTDGMVYELGSVPDFGEVLTHDEWGRQSLAIDACATPKDDIAAQLVDGDAGMFIDLDDIKPLDRGETTFSLHLCGNPSYLKMRAVSDEDDTMGPRFGEDYREGVTTPTEPEAEHGDETEVGELQDFMYVRFWYDPNCNNLKDTESQTVCIQLALDNSDSMDQEYVPGGDADPTKLATTKEGALALIDTLEDEVDPDDEDLDPKHVGVTLFNGDGQDNPVINGASIDPTMDAAALRTLINDDYNGDQADADGSVAAGITDAADRVEDCADYNIVVVVSNGIENIEGSRTAADEALGRDGVDEVIMVLIQPGDATLTEFAGFGGQVFEVNTPEDMEDAWLSIVQQVIAAQVIAGEEVCLYEGPLAGFLDIIDGDEVILPPATGQDNLCTLGAATNTAENCFREGVHCYALDWYLPCKAVGTEAEPGFADLNVCGDEFDNMAEYLIAQYGLDGADDLDGLVNVAQSDTVHFKLIFGAEQCRHNTAPVEEEGPVDNVSIPN